GIVMSSYEGKTRIYAFDPSYPLLTELEQLLKKAYTLLSTLEKKEYFVSKDKPVIQTAHSGGKIKILLELWQKLSTTKRLAFNAKNQSKHESGWNGMGHGEVIPAREGDNVLIFYEKGTWKGKDGEEYAFTNVFRWSFDRMKGLISLEHLRRG